MNIKNFIAGSLAVIAIAGLAVHNVCLHRKLQDLTADMAEVAEMVEKHQDWIDNSSVEGKWKGYKRDMDEYKERVKNKFRSFKKSVKDKFSKKSDDAVIKDEGVKNPAAKVGDAKPEAVKETKTK